MSAPAKLDAWSEIERLAGHSGRAPGTAAERRAALSLKRRLEQLGREASVEPISVLPDYPLTYLIHALLAIVGSVLAVSEPIAGTALVLVAAVSALLDLTGTAHVARRLTARRASQNVVSREQSDRPGALVLVAHYDAARSGVISGRRATELRGRLSRLLRHSIGPFEPFFWSIVVVLVCCGLRVAGADGTALTVVQFLPTVVLIVSVPLLADIMLSPVAPGANDNATGVATVLRLAERYGGRLRHFDVWVLLTGAGEGMLLGMRDFLRAHRGELDPVRTAFVGVEAVGAGRVHYSTREGYLFTYGYHPALLACCAEVAPDHDAQPLVTRTPTDAHAARTRGFPAVAVSCVNELGLSPGRHQPGDVPARLDQAALDRAYEFCGDLILEIDDRVGSELG